MKNTSFLLLFLTLTIANSAKAQTATAPKVVTQAENHAQFVGGDKAMLKFLADNIKYPKMAQENSVEGTVTVQFLIDETGKVIDAKVTRGIGNGCDQEAVRVVKNFPNFQPATQAGKPIKSYFTLPIRFELENNERETLKIAAPDGKDDIYINPTFEPSYKKMTDMEISKFLSKKIKNSNLGEEKGKKTQVPVNLLVDKDGKVASYEITQGTGSSEKINAEALRVAKLITQMEPAMYNNEKVRAIKTVLIDFK